LDKRGKGIMKEGRIVTLIGSKLAKEGNEFFFLGISEKCEDCKLKNTCMNLSINRRYQIEKVRNEIKHDCYIHEDGVCVVEVTEPPITAAVDAKYAFKKSKIVLESPNCEEIGCAFYELCHPAGLSTGDRCTIAEVTDDVAGECKKGRALKIVKMQRETK
jgi:uncharacterized protein (UPF0179 family)